MSKRKKGLMIGVALLVCIAGVLLIRYWIGVRNYRRSVAEIVIENGDIAGVADGVYDGAWDVGMIYAKVRVTVQGGALTAVELLEHRHDRGIAAESIPQRILAEQRVDVDAVSGATNSSQVIKKAVDEAITAGRSTS